MRNVVATMLFCLLMLNSGIVLAYTEHMSGGVKSDKVLRTLVEIRDMVKQLKQDVSKAPRFDAPCYGTPGTPVPCQPALDAAFIVREICCCLNDLDVGVSAIEVLSTKIDELSSCCDSVNTVVGPESALFDCTDFDTLTCCDTINAREQSVISWLKLIYFTLNHGDCNPIP